MRGDLISVFKDTVDLYGNNPSLKSACENTKSLHKCIKASHEIQCDRNRFQENARITVTASRSFEAAEKYAAAGKKVAVLNFANSFNPGGGVAHGARAQEECLCRISTLYDSLTQQEMLRDFYVPHNKDGDDMANDDVILSPDVVVFKSDVDVPELRPESEWFKVDVITCAAPCVSYIGGINDEELYRLHRSRAMKILDASCLAKADAVILGAFGCGAFCNPPAVVAAVYKEVLENYAHAFSDIEFAIYCKSSETENYTVFKSVFES